MHRSVATAQALADRLLAEGKHVFVEHRDLETEKQVQLSK